LDETMRAMAYETYGGPEVLRETALPRPKVGPGFVLIRVEAASVNPVDWKLMSGGLDPIMDVRFPVVPGWDVAGVVEAVGFDTPEFAPGDEVYSYGRRDTVGGGTFAELVALPADIVAPRPAGTDWVRAAALPLAGLTALRVLDTLALHSGETLLVHNGAGGVGRMAIQLAAARGARVIATASQRHHRRLRQLGAEPVDYGTGLLHRVRELAPQGVDAVADLVGGVLHDTLALLRAGGRHASVADREAGKHGGSYVWVRPGAAQLVRLASLVADEGLAVDIAEEFPMERAAEALRLSREGHAAGKIVLKGFGR
jgi:NADPH:quinone reductase-like Zn-dependent oxidoreductase